MRATFYNRMLRKNLADDSRLQIRRDWPLRVLYETQHENFDTDSTQSLRIGVRTAHTREGFLFIQAGQKTSISLPKQNQTTTCCLVFCEAGPRARPISPPHHTDDGKLIYDNGTQQDVLQILKDHGMDTIRLRVWVNPADGWNGRNDVIAKAVRARNAGFRIMIDFHYSDSWADPGQQNKPAAWRTHTFEQLMSDVYWHTYDTMNALATNNVFPEWAQVGNETNNGMLWEDGRASVNMRNFAWLVNSGYDAVKAVNPSTKVIVHISNAYDNALFRWIFDGLRSNGGKWDVTGMSLYPEPANWQTLNNQALTNMRDMRSRYGKD
jgi:hypothetical protein